MWMIAKDDTQYLAHHGIVGQKWGVRRFQNKDGTLTDEGRIRYRSKAENYINRYYNSSVMKEGPHKGDVRYINSKEGGIGLQGTIEFFSKPGKIDVDQINTAKEFSNFFKNSKKSKELDKEVAKYASQISKNPRYVKAISVEEIDKNGGIVTYLDNNDNWYEVDYNPFTKTHGEIKYKGTY